MIMEDLQRELLAIDGITNESIKHHPGKWRVDFNINQQLPQMNIGEDEEEEGEEETKQAAVEEEIVLNAACTVKLL